MRNFWLKICINYCAITNIYLYYHYKYKFLQKSYCTTSAQQNKSNFLINKNVPLLHFFCTIKLSKLHFFYMLTLYLVYIVLVRMADTEFFQATVLIFWPTWKICFISNISLNMYMYILDIFTFFIFHFWDRKMLVTGVLFLTIFDHLSFYIARDRAPVSMHMIPNIWMRSTKHMKNIISYKKLLVKPNWDKMRKILAWTWR